MLNLLEDVTLFAYIYLFCFLGAYSKDVVDTFLEKISEVLILKVLTSSLAVAILLYGASGYLLNKLSYRPFTAVCYTLGLISFEVVVRYSSMQEIFEVMEEYKRFNRLKK
ncbi:hypothetical protein SAMN05660297_02833 [Natronincola peptidivorans]|uniref:Uncharacterized protein n=1 Tax=Natronincola peptidivorans TaxID=426128 RepID=A0A1I0FKG7_9FIRM|nr:hypothetical protein [Natronincola peptidivorans]SET58577.1 hypothetical protein SAMN05660297_02833 [Natronincola peptidivorans]